MGDLQEKADPEGYKSKQIPNYALHSSPAFPYERLWDKLELEPLHWPEFIWTNIARVEGYTSARAAREQAGPISIESTELKSHNSVVLCTCSFSSP